MEQKGHKQQHLQEVGRFYSLLIRGSVPLVCPSHLVPHWRHYGRAQAELGLAFGLVVLWLGLLPVGAKCLGSNPRGPDKGKQDIS